LDYIKKYAIVGFGCAGFNGAKAIRKHSFSGEIHVYSDVDTGPENPMLTTYYASGKLNEDACRPFGSLSSIIDEFGITLHKETAVSIDCAERIVKTETGKSDKYDKILIATGASPAIPPFKAAVEDLYVIRNMSDAGRLKKSLEAGISSAIIVGASVTGVKVAELLFEAGADCLLVDVAPRIFPFASLEDTATEIRRRLEESGIRQSYHTGLTEVSREGEKLTAALSNGGRELTDLVAVCVGTRANTSIAQGIRIDRGIVVNERMETGAEGVYAAGDCCQGTDLQSGGTEIIGLWANAGYQGRTAGANMAGADTVYDGNILHNITRFMGMDFVSLGDNRLPGERKTYKLNTGVWMETVTSGRRISCINILGDHNVCGIIRSMFIKRLRHGPYEPDALQAAMLEAHGVPAEIIGYLGGTNFE